MKRLLLFVLTLVILTSFFISTTAEGSSFHSFQAATNTKNVNVRQGTNKNSKLVEKLEKKNTKVTVTGESYDSSGVLWYYVSTESGRVGYIRSDFLIALFDSSAIEALPELVFERMPFAGGQTLAVYSAPSTRAWRGANGKAAVSTSGVILVAGHTDDWILVKYELDSGITRIGYVQVKSIKGLYSQGEVLQFGDKAVSLETKANFYDDPDTRASLIAHIAKDSAVVLLARYKEWAYVEYKVSGKQVRGFIPLTSIDSSYASTITNATISGSTQASTGSLYGLTISKLATRNGPGTQYDDMGTYSVKGQYIKVLTRAWDSQNKVWWVKCEIPYKNEIRTLWTGYKRFDASSLPIDAIPLDHDYDIGEYVNSQQNTSTGTTPIATRVPSTGTANNKISTFLSWQESYHQFIESGSYKIGMDPRSAEVEEYAGPFDYSNAHWTFALYDIDNNSVPELLVFVGEVLEQIDVYTFQNNSVIHLGHMGGDNFFQFVFPIAGYPGLFSALGGPAMEVWWATFENGVFQNRNVGGTRVDSEGSYTIGYDPAIDNEPLNNLLYNMFVLDEGLWDIIWSRFYSADQLLNESKWNEFISSFH